MEKYRILEELPKPLLEDIIKGQCIPIIGAGFSLNSDSVNGEKMPLWDELGKKFAYQIKDYSYQNPIDAISAYSYEYSRAKLVEKLREWLLIDSTSPGYAHKSFASVQFKTIITTNFDFLLERAFDTEKRPYHVIVDEDQLSINNEYTTIVKMHGDLNHPNNLVVTEEDYDLFLNKNPLLATYVSNLLISKTPLFIGYSLEDSDFRQLWQIINNRLGFMRRTAYIITLEVSSSEIARYERRGVKVVNLKGKKNNYGRILGDLFNQIKRYWSSSIVRTSTITRAESINELTLPVDSYSRLCFFSITTNLISFYRTYVFPVFEKFGFKPVLAEDIISVGDTILAKITALIERSLFVVVDISNSNWIMHEINLAIEYKKDIIYISEERLSNNIKHKHLIIRPNISEIDFSHKFLLDLEKCMQKISSEYNNKLESEPNRLLEKGEYKAAIISVISLLEIELKKKLEYDLIYKGIRTLIKQAIKKEIISKDSEKIIIDVIKIRNKLVHTDEGISAKNAKKLITDVMAIIRNFI